MNVFNKLSDKKETSSQSPSTSKSLIHTHTCAYIIHMHQKKKTFLASSVTFNTHSIFIIVKAEWKKKLSSCLCHYNTGTNIQEIQKTFKITSLAVSLSHTLPKSTSLRPVRHKCHATRVDAESSLEIDTQTPYSRVSQITVYRLMYSECFWKHISVILGREAEQRWPLRYKGVHRNITACFTKKVLFEQKKIKL